MGIFGPDKFKVTDGKPGGLFSRKTSQHRSIEDADRAAIRESKRGFFGGSRTVSFQDRDLGTFRNGKKR